MTDTLDIAAERARHPQAFRSVGLWRGLLLGGALAHLAYLLWLFDFGRVFSQLPCAWVILRLMLDWSGFAGWDHAALWRSMLETVAMAYLGSMLAAVCAVPLGFLGARNVIPERLFHFVTRRLFDGLRGLDQLIWALAFVRAVGSARSPASLPSPSSKPACWPSCSPRRWKTSTAARWTASPQPAPACPAACASACCRRCCR
jgi:phosphonate transport system permease protein